MNAVSTLFLYVRGSVLFLIVSFAGWFVSYGIFPFLYSNNLSYICLYNIKLKNTNL